ncbi:AAA family ATPase [Bradyrhizobium sp. CSS354]|uniref:AAA family ATPase n=1 Tax=Bradyrhizobium sp. CSS354 TaxID=2699172 RepID=UPI0023B156C3|nr:AAA family ATPase [Bradyrhizobium sp. CSS354]MDE5461327.1 AAA family ATPase [Bradyrhizobium sp. CSS354]
MTPRTKEVATRAASALAAIRDEGLLKVAAISPDGGAPRVRVFALPGERQKIEVWIAENNGKANLYFEANIPRSRTETKSKKDDIASVVYLHADLDRAAGESADEARGRHLMAVKSGKVPLPSYVWSSGNGLAALWKLEIPAVSIDEAEGAGAEIAKALGGDRTQNVDRLLRIPHTTNLPNRRKREKGFVPVRASGFLMKTSGSYSLAAFRRQSVGIKAPAERVGAAETVDDLDALNLDQRTKAIVQTGGSDKTLEKDRSRSVYAAICGMIRCGVAHEKIVGVLTDSRYRISERVLERQDPEAHARNEVARVKAKLKAELDAEFEADLSEVDDTPNVVRPDERQAKNPYRHETHAEIMAEPEQPYLIEGLVPEGAFFQVFGDPKAGKSYCMMTAGLCIATGRDFAGLEVRKCRVLYVIAEGGRRRFAERVEAWILKTASDEAAATGEARAKIESRIRSDLAENWRLIGRSVMVDVPLEVKQALAGGPGPWGMIVIDTLIRNFSGAMNDQEAIAKFIHGVDFMRGDKTAVGVVHHSGHGTKTRGAGSVALDGGLDLAIRVWREDPLRVMELVLSRHTPDGLKLVFELVNYPIPSTNYDFDTWDEDLLDQVVLVQTNKLPAAKGEGDSDDDAAIKWLVEIRDAPQPLTERALAERVCSSPTTVHRRIEKLFDQGYVTKNPIGLTDKAKEVVGEQLFHASRE